MWESISRLFSEMDPVVYILFIVGIICCVIELFTPGVGFFGVLGCLAIVAGIVIRMIQGGDLVMFLFMVIVLIGIFIGGFLWIAKSSRNGWLSRTPLFSIQSAVPEGITEGTRDFTCLLGKVGRTSTVLRPIGVAVFGDGEVVDVISQSGVIERGVQVKVVLVEGQKVIVKEI